MGIDVYCDCDICGKSVYSEYAIILCEECFEKVDEQVLPGYHLINNEELYCHKEKSSIKVREEDDRIVFCPFCGDRLVK